MGSDNTIQVVLEYIQKQEENLKEFRENLVGLGDDVEKVRKKTDEGSDSNKKSSINWTELNNAVGFMKQGYQLLNTVYDETITKALEQGNVIRELKGITGDSAEEISRAVQVLDDYKIASDSLLTAQKFLAKDGLSLNIDTLARLSGEYVKLGSVQERSKFLTDNLGKSGLAYAEIMGKGEDAIRAQGEAVASGLIFNDKQLQQMRELEMHQDSVNDNWTAIKNNIAMDVLPAVDDLTTGYLDHGRALEIMEEKGLSTYHAMSQVGYPAALAQAQAEREASDAAMMESQALGELTDSELELAAATEQSNKANSDMLGLMSSISSETKSYIDQQEQVKTKQAEVKAQIDELIAAGWSPLSDKVKDLQTDYDNLGVKFDQNAAKHTEAMNKILYDLYLAKLSVGGLDDAEMKLAQQAGLAFGQLDQASIDTAKNFDTVAQAVTDGKLRVQDMQTALRLMTDNEWDINVVLNIIEQITGGTHIQKGGAAEAGGIVSGFSTGTQGWMTVPPGYPNDSYPVMVESGERFAVLPAGASAAPSGGGGLGGGNFTVVVQVNTPIALFDQQQGKEALLDYVEYGVKTLQERGVI